jgi:hypothetical protein
MSATQRLRASLIGILGVIMAVVGFAAPANATPYTHHHPTTSVSSSHPDPGSTITFCGAGFRPGETVNISIGHTDYPSVTASGSGVWCTSVALSPRLSGKVKLTASSTTSHRSSSTKIYIEKQYGDNGRDHGDGRNHGDKGGDQGDNGRGHGDIDRVLGFGVMGGSNSIARVLERG